MPHIRLAVERVLIQRLTFQAAAVFHSCRGNPRRRRSAYIRTQVLTSGTLMLSLGLVLLFDGLELVQQRLVADLQDFGRLPAVPARLREHALNRLAFGA